MIKLRLKGNTVGSRGVLSRRQEEIIVGTLLGDGTLEKNGNHTRLRVDHTDTQKEYVFWKAEQLIPFALAPRLINEVDKRVGLVYPRWNISTKSTAVFDRFRDLFYVEGRKIIPPILMDIITPLSLAVWYMDDGFRRKDCKGFYLCTSSFTAEEHRYLQLVLKLRFDLDTKIHYQRKYLRIFIPSASADHFNDLVKFNILPVFRYKLL